MASNYEILDYANESLLSQTAMEIEKIYHNYHVVDSGIRIFNLVCFEYIGTQKLQLVENG